MYAYIFPRGWKSDPSLRAVREVLDRQGIAYGEFFPAAYRRFRIIRASPTVGIPIRGTVFFHLREPLPGCPGVITITNRPALGWWPGSIVGQVCRSHGVTRPRQAWLYAAAWERLQDALAGHLEGIDPIRMRAYLQKWQD